MTHFYLKIWLMSLLLACSAAKSEEDAELQETVDAALIGIGEADTDNVADNQQGNEQQNFAEQQDFAEQQENVFGQQFEQNDEQMMFNEDTQGTLADNQVGMQTDLDAGNVVGQEDGMNDVTPAIEDTAAKMGEVYWIGYVYKEAESLVNVEILTKNNPQFDIYQELNRAKQKEIVVRYYDTKLRKKMRRDIDASEFRSPVAYIRTRDGDKEGIVEVVLTVRDEVQAKYLAKDGSLLLSFPIPQRYFGNDDIAKVEPSAQAVDLSAPLIVVKVEEGNTPRLGRVLGYVFNREVFESASVDDLQALPDDTISFGNTEAGNNAAVNYSNEIEAGDNSLLDNDNSDDLNQQENFQQNEQQDFQQNEQQNFQQDQQQDFQQNQQQDFQQNQQQDFQQDQQQNFQQNEQNAAVSQPVAETLVSTATIFLHVGQDPADNFSAPADFSDGSKSAEGLSIVEEGNAAPNSTQGAAGGDTASNNMAEQGTAMSNTAGGEDLELGQVTENNLENNAQLEAALLDDDSLLAPLHGTEAIGKDSAAEDIAVSEAKAVRMVFRDAPLSEVLHAIRTETGTNFIFRPDIGSRKIFLNLSNVPWDEALRALLEINNLAMVKIGDNLVRIDTISDIEEYKKQMRSLKIQEGRSRPTKVMILKVSHAKADTMKEMISSLLGAIIKADDRVKVDVDARTNSLVIEALPEDLAKIRVLIDRLDYRAPQVRISSRIVEVANTDSLDFGIRWSGPINYDQSRGLGFGSLLFPNFATATFAIDGGGGQGPAGGDGASLGVHFGSLNDSVALDLRLSLAEVQDQAEVLQNSNVVVKDGVGATITAGTIERIVIPGTSAAEGGVEPINNTVTLNVTPQITNDSSVDMIINITSNERRANNSSATRAINTNLVKKSGETIAIGGLYTVTKEKSHVGVPVLSSIPILGALFRSHNRNTIRKELIFLITPTILHSGRGGDDDNDFGDEGDFNTSNNADMQQGNQFQQNQFQQDQNFNTDNINAENPSNAEWQANNDQFQQQGQQQGNEQNFDQNNEQLDNEEQFNEEANQNEQQNQDDDEQIDFNEQQNEEQQEEALTIDQQEDLGNQF